MFDAIVQGIIGAYFLGKLTRLQTIQVDSYFEGGRGVTIKLPCPNMENWKGVCGHSE